MDGGREGGNKGRGMSREGAEVTCSSLPGLDSLEQLHSQLLKHLDFGPHYHRLSSRMPPLRHLFPAPLHPGEPKTRLLTSSTNYFSFSTLPPRGNPQGLASGNSAF